MGYLREPGRPNVLAASLLRFAAFNSAMENLLSVVDAIGYRLACDMVPE